LKKGSCPETNFFWTKCGTNKRERASIGRIDAPTPAKKNKTVSNLIVTGQTSLRKKETVPKQIFRDKPL
jgi:hypothetical protein